MSKTVRSMVRVGFVLAFSVSTLEGCHFFRK